MMRSFFLFLCLFLLSTCQKKDDESPSITYNVEADLVVNGNQIINLNNDSYCDLIGGNVIRFSHSSQSQHYKYTVGQTFNSISDDYLYFNFIDTMSHVEPVSIDRMVELLNTFPDEPTKLVPELSFMYEEKIYKTAIIDGSNGELVKADPDRKHKLEFKVVSSGSCDIVNEVISVDYTYNGYAYNISQADSVLVNSSTFKIYLRGAP